MKLCYVVANENIRDLLLSLHLNGKKFLPTDNMSEKEAYDLVASSLRQIHNYGFFAQRERVEDIPTIKQIIPSVTIVDPDTDNILLYQRKATHTEKRLSGMWTPVFGGHIDPDDSIDLEFSDLATYNMLPSVPIIMQALGRELLEETGINLSVEESSNDLVFEGFIQDNSNEVGQVHLGVFFVLYRPITNDLCQAILRKPEIADLKILESPNYGFPYDSDIELESWAEIVLDHLEEKRKIMYNE